METPHPSVKFVQVDQEDEAIRLDNYLVRILKGVPKSLIYRLIREGQVRVNKKRAKPSTRLQGDDMVRIPPVRTAAQVPVGSKAEHYAFLNQAILHEDSEILVLNKPSGIAVHGGSGVSLGVIEALRALREDLKYLELVHRLDKETSGCLLLAKKRSILKALQKEFENRTVEKIYVAILDKPWEGDRHKIVNAALKKMTRASGERIVRVHQEGKTSETSFTLIENFKTACLIEAMPLTGRTHQIRVHSASIGHPIIGDEKYKAGDGKEKRLYLHAKSIQFNLNGRSFHFVAPLNGHFLDKVRQLRSI